MNPLTALLVRDMRIAVRVVREVEGDLFIDADEVRMQQVLWSLLRNAVRFSELGGTVKVSARRDEAMRGFVAVHAAKIRRRAQRAGDIGAERQRPEARGERRRGTAGGAAGRAGDIPGIVGWWCHKCH